MCFVRSFAWSFSVMDLALVLSQGRADGTVMRRSLKAYWSHWSCLVARLSAMYLASVVEVATQSCFRDFHVIVASPMRKMYPLKDRLVSRQVAKSASVYPSRVNGFLAG